jgi:hypothetical protein
MLDEGGYEVFRRDTIRKEHEISTLTGINEVACELTI